MVGPDPLQGDQRDARAPARRPRAGARSPAGSAAIARPGDVAARLGGDEFALILTPVDGVDGLRGRGRAGARRARDAGGHPRRRARRRRARRHRLPPRARRAAYDALLRHADVALERAKASRREVGRVLGRVRRARRRAADARRGAQPRDRRGRARARLPAAGRARDGTAARGRGAGALAAPGARAARAGGLHRAGRADRRDPGADDVGRARARSTRPSAGARPGSTCAWRSTCPCARSRRSCRASSPLILDGAPRPLELEITETVGMEDADGHARRARGADRLGIRLSVDDFGTGFSSLAYLKQLPVQRDQDRPLVRDGDGREASDRAIVRSTIDLARHLGMEVVAEGVESEEALRRAAGARLPPRAGLRDQPAARRRGAPSGLGRAPERDPGPAA